MCWCSPGVEYERGPCPRFQFGIRFRYTAMRSSASSMRMSGVLAAFCMTFMAVNAKDPLVKRTYLSVSIGHGKTSPLECRRVSGGFVMCSCLQDVCAPHDLSACGNDMNLRSWYHAVSSPAGDSSLCITVPVHDC